MMPPPSLQQLCNQHSQCLLMQASVKTLADRWLSLEKLNSYILSTHPFLLEATDFLAYLDDPDLEMKLWQYIFRYSAPITTQERRYYLKIR
mmetsp:Transcript_39980/g.64855  ORF Transcript_39980/g.64855 Transcript_39980/m.64855 type:complete len:91 (-) Transcript_39980:872-1144(-)